eukprot:TRINITY_DN1971_c0_g1_i2.p1 TRINITY_DN1971_c0_g1~~TRINITY_DN1971_c0_g1_i2.p1  ORF type:complete len:199 (-),score=36.50 TRINITY_DN1971_c0_g1_i2:73-669(-)
MQAPRINTIQKEKESNRTCELRNQAICIENCEECTFNLTGKAVKITIVNCKNTTIIVDAPPITGTGEIINCSSVTLHINSTIPTLQMDGSTDCIVKISTLEAVQNIFSSNSTNLSIILKSTEGSDVVHEITPGPTTPEIVGVAQWISRFSPEGVLSTELVVREGAGYATTKREKQIADARDERFRRAFVAHARANRGT